MATPDQNASRLDKLEDGQQRTREDFHRLSNELQLVLRDQNQLGKKFDQITDAQKKDGDERRREFDTLLERVTSIYPPGNSRKRMSENGENGSYQVIRAEVDAVKDQLDDFRSFFTTQLTNLSGEIKALGSTIENRIAGARPDFSRFGTAATIIVTIALAGIGGFATYVKSNIEGSVSDLKTAIRDTNITVSTLAKETTDGFRVSAKETRDAIKVSSDNAIPRSELENRVGSNKAGIEKLEKQQDYHSTQIATAIADAIALKADVERMKGDIVTRRENEGHWDDFQNRLNLLSNRINDLAKISGGGDLVEQLKQLRDQFNTLQGKFINVPKGGDK